MSNSPYINLPRKYGANKRAFHPAKRVMGDSEIATECDTQDAHPENHKRLEKLRRVNRQIHLDAPMRTAPLLGHLTADLAPPPQKNYQQAISEFVPISNIELSYINGPGWSVAWVEPASHLAEFAPSFATP